MLGHAPSSQDREGINPDHVLLLQLFSDYGVTFMFCDVGEMEFWITREDLMKRDFSNVWVYACGG